MESQLIAFKYVINALVFSVLGLALLALSFVVFDKLTPGILWKEIVEGRNIALAIVAGAFTIAMALIIASSIHG
jgi:putative membrane protein